MQQIQEYRIDKVNNVVFFFLINVRQSSFRFGVFALGFFLFSMVFNNILTLLITV